MITADLPQGPEFRRSDYDQGSGNGRFFETYRSELANLFRVLDMPADVSSSLEQALEVTQPWVKGDHFKPDSPVILAGERNLQARELYRAMGLVAAQPLELGRYDQIIVLGGMQRANNMRLRFLAHTLRQGDVRIKEGGNLVLWGGQRPRFDPLEAGPIQENRAALNNTAHPAHKNAWLGALESGRNQLHSETDLIRLSALRQLGNLGLKRMHISLGIPEPLVSRYEFDGPNYRVTLLNTAAVQRPHGEPRHTTEACARQWLQATPPPEHARVGFISSNPYIRRTALVVQRVVAESGRADVKIVPAGPAAYPDAKDYLFLGEIARNLYEDSKLRHDS